MKRFNLGFLQKRKKNSDYFQHVTDFPKHFFCFCWPSFSFLSIVLIYAHSIWDLQIWDLQIFIGFKAFLSFQKHFFFSICSPNLALLSHLPIFVYKDDSTWAYEWCKNMFRRNSNLGKMFFESFKISLLFRDKYSVCVDTVTLFEEESSITQKIGFSSFKDFQADLQITRKSLQVFLAFWENWFYLFLTDLTFSGLALIISHSKNSF